MFLLVFIILTVFQVIVVPVSCDDFVSDSLLPIKRIAGGLNSKIVEFPYIVSLEFSDGPMFICGASILSPYFVITAAHCVEGESSSELQIRAGSSFSQRGGSVHQLRNFTIHPERLRTHKKIYDLAILQLAEPIELDNITTRSIPMFESGEESKKGTKATVIGWGCIDENKTYIEQLQSLSMTILDKKDCWSYTVKERRICASASVNDHKPRGVCSGDSGGPLVIAGKLAGIVSLGSKNTLDSNLSPNMFTEISRYRKWIDNIMGVTNGNEDNDENAAIKEFPYLVSVELAFLASFACGGTIISPWYILTAANCIKSTFSYQVRAGSSFKEEFGTIHRIRNITIHSGYTLNEELNDLAILLLEDPIEIDNKTKSVISMFESNKEIKKGSVVKTAGWGCPIEDKATLAQQLRNHNMTIIDKQDCMRALKVHYSHLEKGQICIAVASTNNKTRDICYRDAGNPLIVDGKLAGVVSRNGMSYGNEPHKFMEISHHRKWIDETVETLNAANKHYIQQKDEEDSAIKNVPYLVSLEYSFDIRHKCGGAIISPYYVLTAARCAGIRASAYQVRAGSSYKEKGGTLHSISKFIVQGDLALVRLENPIELDDKTKRPILMFLFDEESKNGSIATLGGWGFSKKNETDKNLIQNISMSVVDKITCKKIYKYDYSELNEGEICASIIDKNTRDLLYEDSGNPLVIEGKLAGVFSSYFETLDSKPNKFIEVAHYRKWIDETIKT